MPSKMFSLSLLALVAVASGKETTTAKAAPVEIPVPAPDAPLTTKSTTLSTTTTTTKGAGKVATTEDLFRIPSPIDDPAPELLPAPLDWTDEPSPSPAPAPTDLGDIVTKMAIAEPAPETTDAPLDVCEDSCFSHTCDFILDTEPSWTCSKLESQHHCDCTGCSCLQTTQHSCLNACSQVFDTCSCASTCSDTNNCCDDFTLFCSDFGGDVNPAETGTDATVGIVVGVGVALLIVGAVGGFFVTRKVLLNQRIKRENELLRTGNANLDTSYNAPSHSSKHAPKSEFGLL